MGHHEPAHEPPNAARQRAAEDLFDEVRLLRSGEREAAIDAASQDPWVRAEVRSLLRFDGPTIATVGQARAASLDAEACVGLSAGGFTLRRVIGIGGMGTVFEADQELPARRIAVKILHAPGVRASALARFRKESDFLARLDHQNIARVISAGTLRLAGDAGERPYFAMELVEDGRPITRWARDERIGRVDIVRMMATACEAVGSGHRAGIVHLDLKPGNLLVAKNGSLRVIDYGIARSVEESDSSGEMPFAGTPQYMAPEQCARGSRIDSRADVYALGLILYELLAQRLPYEMRGTAWAETVRMVREAVPVDLRRVDSTIPRELEAVVRRAIAKDPDARYGTASELGDELRRWLDDEPVLALAPRMAETASRFLRRNPVTSVLAAAAAIAVAAGVVTSFVFAVHAQRSAEDQRIAASRAHLQAAVGAIATGEFGAAVQHLERVPEDLRGWESRHLRARTSNHELYAISAAEILSVDAIDATNEIACGITGGHVLVADRTMRNPPVRYDLRGAWRSLANPYIVSIAGSLDGQRIYLTTNEFDALVLDRRDDSVARLARDVMRVRPSGSLLACAMRDGTAALVDPETGRTVASVAGDGGAILDASIASNGRSALIARKDGSLRMFDIDPDVPSVRERWRTGTQAVTSRAPAVSPDGSTVLVAWQDERLTRHDPATGVVLGETDLPGGSVFMLTISPDNRTAAASSWTNEVRLIDMDRLAITRRLGGTVTQVWGIDFTADGSRLVGRIAPSPINPRSEVREIECIGGWLVDSESAVEDRRICGTTVAATHGPEPGCFTLVDSEGGVWEFRAREGTTRRIGTGPQQATRVARSRDWIAVGDRQGVLHFHPLKGGTIDPSSTAAWKSQVFPILLAALAASSDGTRIFVGDLDRSVAAVSTKDGTVLWKRETPEPTTSPEGRRFVSRLVFMDEGRLITYAGRLGGVPRVALRTSDGSVAPNRSIGGGVEAEDAVFRRTDGRVYALGVTGALLVGEPRMLDRSEPLALNGGVLCLDASESRMFVATRDGSMRVVGFDPAFAIARFDSPRGNPITVAFDDEGDAVTVVTNQGIARTWRGATPTDSLRGTPAVVPRPDGLRVPRLRELPPIDARSGKPPAEGARDAS
jgi:outer membrane protein assembly factor BamB